MALLPKCPMCAAAYLSFFSAFGVDRWAPPYLWPLTYALFAGSIAFLAVRAWRRSYYPPFVVLASGAGLLSVARLEDSAALLTWPGLALFLVGALWSTRRSPGRYRPPRHRSRPISEALPR